MSSEQSLSKSDAIVICCSYDLRVCDHACELMKSDISETLVISGKFGNWTQHIWEKPEAEVFYERAIENGIKSKQILMETEATNFGENVTYARALIPEAETVTFVSKPNSLLRVKLTAQAQWPEVNPIVSCPDINFPSEVSNIIGVWGLINEMVGDIERINKYPDKGFQIPHLLPEEIMKNWDFLIEQGFTHHLMPNKQMRSNILPAARAKRR